MTRAMEPAILLHIAIPLLVTLNRAPEMILTKDKKDADQYKEVVNLMVKSEQTVVMFDAVTFEQFGDFRSSKQIHGQFFTKHPVSITMR